MKYRFLRFPEGKFKAVTVSYDDGTRSDLRLAEMIDKYGMRATFNICSTSVGRENNLSKDELLDLISRGHEIANHGANHLALGISSHLDGIRDVLDCRLGLEGLLDRNITGFAYPDTMRNISGENYESIRSYLKALGISYARLAGKDNDLFSLPEDFHAWMPTAHHNNPDLFEYIDKFLALDEEKLYRASRHPRLFYLWGHSSEFENAGNWDRLEKIAQKLSGKSNIWYATNMQIYEYVRAYESLVFRADNSAVYNPSLITVCFNADGKNYTVRSGETVKL